MCPLRSSCDVAPFQSIRLLRYVPNRTPTGTPSAAFPTFPMPVGLCDPCYLICAHAPSHPLPFSVSLLPAIPLPALPLLPNTLTHTPLPSSLSCVLWVFIPKWVCVSLSPPVSYLTLHSRSVVW
eukprot:RCo053197